MSVTMKDIARLAGVSQQAVSAVLNNRGGSRVSAATRKCILQLAEELNYVPNAAAVTLSGKSTRTIGMLGDLRSQLLGQLIAETTDILMSRGYNVITGFYPSMDTKFPMALREFESRGVDGVMIFNSNDQKTLERSQTVPYVFCSHYNPHPDVTVDYQGTGYLGCRHLLEHGHRRIGFLTVLPCDSPRLFGWRKALEEAGVEPEPDWVIELQKLEGLFDRLLKHLRGAGITALFCSNDYVAAKTLKALTDHGIRVPDEMALVGCDGYSFVDFCPVTLTTVIQPIRPQGKLGVDLLLQRIAAHELRVPPAGFVVQPILRCGGSCGCPAEKIERLYSMNTFATLEKDLKMNFNVNVGGSK